MTGPRSTGGGSSADGVIYLDRHRPASLASPVIRRDPSSAEASRRRVAHLDSARREPSLWFCALIFALGALAMGWIVGAGLDFAIEFLWPGAHPLAILVVRILAVLSSAIGANLALQAQRRDLERRDACEACGGEIWTREDSR